jgi:hypothetical protein
LKFRKRLVEVEAIQWTGSNKAEVEAFVGKELRHATAQEAERGDPYRTVEMKHSLVVPVMKGGFDIAYAGDWIIRGVAGEIYPCDREVFDQTYEAFG